MFDVFFASEDVLTAKFSGLAIIDSESRRTTCLDPADLRTSISDQVPNQIRSEQPYIPDLSRPKGQHRSVMSMQTAKAPEDAHIDPVRMF